MGFGVVDPVFVIPVFVENSRDLAHLEKSLGSLVSQTDERWRAVLVDDCSPFRWDPRDLAPFDASRMHLERRPVNSGPGECRNHGVRRAAGVGAPFVLFQDADDVAHADRVRLTREYFREDPDADMLYSAFDVIDEDGRPVPRGDVSGSVLEVVDSHASPVEGRDAWIPIATRTGYTTLTSTVAVRTELAARYPFPACHVSEDSHAWLRMMAGGGALRYMKEIRAQYRVPRGDHGSASRERHGEGFYWTMLQVDLDGFVQAMHIALERGALKPGHCPELLRAFHLKQAETMESEGRLQAAAVCRSLAACPLPGTRPPAPVRSS
ncbi:glycosyltransferase family A protein [Nocardiopsis tropica]|uniref:glycosyltransferase family 2 protein n=1 Tax=Nocardiopsis tropica TaxID=109330 RepID=UPI002E88C17A|nr:glycosyltransferase family A protein [Nocardiopsis tropica]